MVLQVMTKLDATSPMHIYYDIDMINNDQANGEPSPNLIYNETRNSPYLNCPSNYYVSIIRFNLQTPSLPVFIPQVKLKQADPNKLIYQFYMINTSTNAHFTENVTYIPTNTTIPTPPAPLIIQDLSTEYYFVYTIQHWIKMLNSTLNSIAIAGGITPAFFYFDVNTSLLKLYIPTSWGTTYKLFCNKQLQTLLDSFEFEYINTTNYGFLHSFQFYNNNYKNNVTLNSIAYYEMLQESTTLPLLNPIKSLVFTTSLFPVVASLTSPPKVFGADSTLFSNGNNSSVTPIITDFEVNVSNLNTYKESVQYIPSGEYRMIDLYGESPCSALQFAVVWKDMFGGLHNFKLNSGCGCDIKMMFRRKDYNNVTLPIS